MANVQLKTSFKLINCVVGKSLKSKSSSASSGSSKISTKYVEHILDSLTANTMRPSTRKKYHEVWTKFSKFIISLDRKPPMWERRAALFCAYLVDKGNQSGTIRSYISAIKKVLKEDGYNWNDNIVLFDSLTKACRLCNDHVKTRLPIQIGLLELLLFELDRVF